MITEIVVWIFMVTVVGILTYQVWQKKRATNPSPRQMANPIPQQVAAPTTTSAVSAAPASTQNPVAQTNQVTRPLPKGWRKWLPISFMVIGALATITLVRHLVVEWAISKNMERIEVVPCTYLPINKEGHAITFGTEWSTDYCMPPGVNVQIIRMRDEARYQIQTPDGTYTMLPEKRDSLPGLPRGRFRSLSGQSETIRLFFFTHTEPPAAPKAQEKVSNGNEMAEDDNQELEKDTPEDKLDEEKLKEPPALKKAEVQQNLSILQILP